MTEQPKDTSLAPIGKLVFRLRVEELKKVLEQIRTEYVQISYDIKEKGYVIEEELLEWPKLK